MRVSKVRASLIAVAAASLVTTVLAQQPPPLARPQPARAGAPRARRTAGQPVLDAADAGLSSTAG